MKESAFASDETIDSTFATGGKFVGGGMGFAASTMTRNDKAGVDDGADERDAFVDRLSMNLARMKGEVEALEKLANNGDIAHDLMLLRHGDDNVKIIDVATIVLVTEVDSDKTVELVEVNIGEELASEIADDDAVARATIKEALVIRESGPIFAGTTNGDAGHRVVINNLVPEKLSGLIKGVTVVGVAVDLVFLEVIVR